MYILKLFDLPSTWDMYRILSELIQNTYDSKNKIHMTQKNVM